MDEGHERNKEKGGQEDEKQYKQLHVLLMKESEVDIA